MTYYGDIAEDATITFFFTSKVNGVPTALAGSPALSAYIDGGATEVTAGITLTANFDSRTGMNKVVVDTSADAAYVAGSDVEIVITTGTLNGSTQVGVVVGSFSIENRNVATISDGAVTAAVVATGAIDADAIATNAITAAKIATNAITSSEIADNAITAAKIASDAITAAKIAANAIGASELAADAVAEIADAIWDESTTGHTTAGTFGEQAKTDIDAILADTNELQTDDVPGLIAALNDLSAAQVNAEVDTALTDIGLDHLVSAAVVGADVTDNSIIAKLAASGATADWDTFVNTTDSLQAMRDTLALEATVAALNNLSEAQVNAQMLDVMNTDTITLPGQTAPPLAPTHRQAIAWLYKVMRNRKDQTATLWQLYADNETTVDAKATISDDGTTGIKQEIVSGP